jgi:fatty-acyl-CoA synthase
MANLALADVIQGHASSNPLKVALHFEGEDIRYGQLWQRIEAATAKLVEQGVRPSDRVAWLGFNDPAMLVLLFALARLGAILLPLNYRLAPAEISAILSHAGVSLIVTDAAHQAHDAVTGEGLRLREVNRLGVDTGGGADASHDLSSVQLTGHGASPVLLVYTSGTTGKPKGALHTQAGLIANCVISGDAHDFSANDHVLTALPMFHVGGLCIQTLPALYAGAMVTLHNRFDASAWLRDVALRQPTVSLLVPATLRAVLDHADFAATDLSSLKLLNAGSSTIPTAMIEGFHARGVPVCQVYGSTETGPVSIYLKAQDALQHAGSTGKVGLDVDVRLVDPEGQDAAPGAVGELWIRAPNVMTAYWNDPHNPAFEDGWFKSGDLARRDEDGFYWVVGRSKDMIISGGENIYPAEIENVLADCPLIAEAAVIGQPDAQWGEVAVAVIVKQPAAQLDAAGVMKLFDGKLARFKYPRRVIFADALPKTALGKVIKAKLASFDK